MASTGSITRTSSPTRQAILLQDRLACEDAQQRTLAAYDVTLATIACKLTRPCLATCPRPLRRQAAPKLDLNPSHGPIRVTDEAPSHSDRVIGGSKASTATYDRHM